MDPMMIAALAQMAQQMQQNSLAAGQAAGSGGDVYSAIGQMPGVSPIAAAGLGYLSGRKAKKEKRKLKKKIERARRTTEAIFGKGMSQQEALARQATQQQLGGFESAKKAAQFAAQNAKTTALQRGQQMQGQLSQSLTDRGLGSTTVGANLGRGINADVTGALGGIDQALGNYFGQLAMGRSGIEAQGTQNLADLASQRTNFDIQNANYWTPFQFNQLGSSQQRLAGMQQPQMQQMDPQMLAMLFNQGGSSPAMGGGGKPPTQQQFNLAALGGNMWG